MLRVKKLEPCSKPATPPTINKPVLRGRPFLWSSLDLL